MFSGSSHDSHLETLMTWEIVSLTLVCHSLHPIDWELRTRERANTRAGGRASGRLGRVRRRICADDYSPLTLMDVFWRKRRKGEREQDSIFSPFSFFFDTCKQNCSEDPRGVRPQRRPYQGDNPLTLRLVCLSANRTAERPTSPLQVIECHMMIMHDSHVTSAEQSWTA